MNSRLGETSLDRTLEILHVYMAVPKSVLPDSELKVLNVLWSSPQLSAREVAERLYPKVNTSSIGTVQKLIARLEEKALLTRHDDKTPHRFTATVSREDVAGMQLEECARKLSGGSLSPFVSHLVQARQLSESEREEIRQLLDEDTQTPETP